MMSTADFEVEATRRMRLTQEALEHLKDLEFKADLYHRRGSLCDKPCLVHLQTDFNETHSGSHQPGFFTPKIFPVLSSTPTQCLHLSGEVHACDECLTKTTLVAENEVEAHKVSNNYKFGFKKWKSHVTERPWEDRSQIVKELYSELNMVKTPLGSIVTCGNILYVFLFGWWLSLFYFLLTALMFFTVLGAPYGKMCWRLTGYFLWPFGKVIRKTGSMPKKYFARFGKCEAIPEVDEVKETTYLLNNAARIPDVLQTCTEEPNSRYWKRFSTYLWLMLAYPVLIVVHSVACILSWSMIFSIPVAKINARMIRTVLLMPPEQVAVQQPRRTDVPSDDEVVLCCYYAFSIYYYKYTVDGINVFAVNIIPLVIFTILMGYLDVENHYTNSVTKFTLSLVSIMPLSYYIGMAIASISAQSNFAVGAVVNATFGSIIELTFYITALIKGVKEGNKCYEEVVKSALTGTLLGCVLFVPGLCMLIGGIKHPEQRFNSRSAGIGSALLFISVGGVFAPTLFSKAYGNLICQGCRNISENATGPFECLLCHSDIMENNGTLFVSHIQPLIHTVSVLLPCAYLIGLLFCLKTHSHIYDIHISGCHVPGHHHSAVALWSRWKSLIILLLATVCMSACADLATEHISPVLYDTKVSQYFIGVTLIAMVPELPEIVNGIQFALQNNMSLSIEVGSSLAVQVCMIQMPVLVLFSIFSPGFTLLFSDLHLWASIFSVILVNYIFMDGKCDYFQGTVLVMVYFILMAMYYFAPSPAGC